MWIIYLNKTRTKKDQSNETEIKKDPEDFFQDFLSSLENSCLIKENKCGRNEHITDTTSLSKDIKIHLEGGPKDIRVFPDFKDSFLPRLNLL